MLDFFTHLFDSDGFPARWHCGTAWLENPSLGWLHILSDLAIFGAYTAIPLVIAFFVLRRKDIPFPRIFWLFVIFIFACGTTHLIDAIIFSHPIYRFAGLVKLVTAAASWSTVVALGLITPQALRLPGLAKLNSELVREVEERKETESALLQSQDRLRENEERLRLAVIAGKLGSWEWDLATNMLECSAELEAMRGREPRVARSAFEDLTSDVHPDDRPRVVQALQDAAHERGEFRSEFRIVLPNKAIRWLEARGKMFHRHAAGPGTMAGICIDITDRKRSDIEREELLSSERAARGDAERANRVKDEFLSVVSHELRTPLSAILGYAELLQSGGIPPQETPEMLAAIKRNSAAQAQIIDDLLDMNRIISGKIRLDVRTINLTEVIDAALGTIKPAADAKNIRVQKVLDPRASAVLGDFDRLQQVLCNLLSNAVKFTPKGGRVQISLARVNSHLEIDVADTGEGIPPDFLPYVFDRFRQAEDATSRRHGGLGLGLAIAKQIVELHGGSIRAVSGGVNQGSTFTVVLPLQAVHPKEADQIHPTADRGATESQTTIDLSGVKVLVVDDDPDAREIVGRLLRQRKADVVTAASADEALELLRKTRPAVLLSDIGMPGKDGYQFIREVRLLPAAEGGHVPAVALTAFARSEDRRRALLGGYQSHVAKPVDPGELLAVIAMLTGRTTV